jgi:hypothetical protein
MTLMRFVGAVGIALSLTFLSDPASAKSEFWYSLNSCQFYPGGGRRTPAEIAACQKQRAGARALHFCRDQASKSLQVCGPNQQPLWSTRH